VAFADEPVPRTMPFAPLIESIMLRFDAFPVAPSLKL
jgi:hypothetical protein